ncbi:tetratricopeptide repeat protein [Streptomyces sp. NPDC059340]|uniref:tetratricopeptide repeat protein n=1 Tax=Streptomyces sp. NPDC059340 TaxID=3346806 RepID=UPI003689E02E
MPRTRATPSGSPRSTDGSQNLHLHLGQWRRAVAIDELLGQVMTPPAQPGAVPAPRPEAPARRRPQPTRVEPADTERALIQETGALIAAQDHTQARQVAERFVRAHPGSVAGLFQLGLVLNEAGDYEASLKAYERCLALAPRLTRLHRNKLNSWRGLGDLDTPPGRHAAGRARLPGGMECRTADQGHAA